MSLYDRSFRFPPPEISRQGVRRRRWNKTETRCEKSIRAQRKRVLGWHGLCSWISRLDQASPINPEGTLSILDGLIFLTQDRIPLAIRPNQSWKIAQDRRIYGL